MIRRARIRASVAVLSTLLAAPALAQERTWDVEFYAGGVIAGASGAGTRALPAPGAPLVTSTPIFPSRETSSWFFGDGAALLNAVNGQFGTSARITPLDALLVSPGAGGGAVAGARLRCRVNARVSAEFSLDMLPGGRSAPEGFAAAVDATRQSFTSAFSGLLSTGPFSGVVIDATAAADEGARRDISATAALNVHVKNWRALAPYATVGGGVIGGVGSSASASLTGRYRFTVLGDLPVDETDSVTVRFRHTTALALVLGGGARHALSGVWGLTFDARVLVGEDGTRVLLDARPASTRGTPPGFIESFTNPAIQFSNDPATGRRSSLSGPALEGFEVFKGGRRVRTLITLALSRRF
jgi:hypothetical protein